jgi:hypothetical protein
MSTTTTANEIGLRKVKREGLKKSYAVRILPPDFQMDETGGENHKYMFYYTSRNFKPKAQECTKHVWRRAEGRGGVGVVRDGFDSISGKHDFLLHEKDGKIVAVDLLPSNTYNAKSNAPMDTHDLEYVELAINTATGEIEFLKVPIGVTKQQLQQLITELDKLDLIQAGDVIGGAFRVYEMQGNRLKIEPPPKGSTHGRPGHVGF